MSKTLLYRIQDAKGEGPFKAGFSKRWLDNRTDEERPVGLLLQDPKAVLNAIHARPFADSIGFACRSLEQLSLWFSHRERQRLHAFGYKAVEIDADGILLGNEAEVIFHRAKRLNVDVRYIPIMGIPHDAAAKTQTGISV